MSDNKIISLPEEQSIGERWIVKIYNNRKTILSGFLLFLVLIVFSLRFLPQKKTSYQEYQKIQSLYNEWEKEVQWNQTLLDDLVLAIREHPELSSKYSHKIHQRFIALSKEQEFPLEIQPQNPSLLGEHFQAFSQATFLITSNQYQLAYEEAKKLQSRILGDLNFKESKNGQILLAFNLLRLATLSNKLENSSQEIDHYKQLKQLIFLNEKINPIFHSFIDHLTNNGVSLIDYIQIRETALTSS